MLIDFDLLFDQMPAMVLLADVDGYWQSGVPHGRLEFPALDVTLGHNVKRLFPADFPKRPDVMKASFVLLTHL